jgi:hypothetical protein
MAAQEGSARRIITTVLLLCWVAAAAGAASREGLFVIHDQSALSVVNGKAAQDFESSRDGIDSEGADDFTVEGTEQVVIEQVLLMGSYSKSGIGAATVGVRILSDQSGPGQELCSITGVVVGDSSGDLTVDLVRGCPLTPGTYWLAAQADLAWSGGGQWYWDSSSTEVGAHGMWRNIGADFPTFCTSFGTMPDCFGGSELSYLFSVSGSAALIFADGFESGNTGGWTAAVP